MNKKHYLLAFAGAALLFGADVALQPPTLDPTAIDPAQQTYFDQTGAYLQVLPDNQLPSYEDGTVAADLGGNLPPGYVINVYEAEGGKGYWEQWTDGTGTHSRGYGPEAPQHTWDTPIIINSATSTDAEPPIL